MYNFRRSLLILLLVGTSALLLAPIALGEGSNVEVVDESGPSPTHCGEVDVNFDTDVVTGGCEFHVASDGPITWTRHIFGIESVIASCNEEFQVNLDEQGEGYTSEVDYSGSGPCENFDLSEEPYPWETEIDESGANQLAWHWKQHFRYPNWIWYEQWWTAFNGDEIVADDVIVGNSPPTEIDGHWVIEDPESFHVEHL